MWIRGTPPRTLKTLGERFRGTCLENPNISPCFRLPTSRSQTMSAQGNSILKSNPCCITACRKCDFFPWVPSYSSYIANTGVSFGRLDPRKWPPSNQPTEGSHKKYAPILPFWSTEGQKNQKRPCQPHEDSAFSKQLNKARDES